MKTSDGEMRDEIGELTDKAVEGINLRTAESWLATGEMVNGYVEMMRERFGDTRDWYVALADHPASIHRSTMLRNYAGAWRIWGMLSEETRGLMNLKGIKVSHLAQVLSGRFSQEDREVHLKHAADEGMSVSEFKAYLNGSERTDSSVQDAATGDDQSMDGPVDGHDDAPVGSTAIDASISWTQKMADLQSSLTKTYSHLVGLKKSLGGREIPSEITLAVGNLVRFAVTQGMLSRDDLRRIMEISPSAIEIVTSSCDQGIGEVE